MRILNITQSYAPFFEFGGPPAKVKALAEGLAQKGHAVTVLTSDWGLDKRLAEFPGEISAQPNPFGRKREVNGVTAIYLPNWFHYRATSWNPALPRYLRARLQNFDVVHIFGLYDLLGPRAAAACRKRKIPYVLEPIGMFIPIIRNIFLKRIYHQFWGRQLFAGAAAVIATSEQEQSELEAGGIPREKIILRRNGVEIPKTLPAAGAFRASLQIPPQSRLILFLGRLSQKKSPGLLLRAFADILQNRVIAQQDLHLAFVGPDEADMLGRLQKISEELGVTQRVHFVKPLSGEKKWAAYRDADIFVLPSQNENFGNTAAEAVAAGTPVIVTDQCGIAPLLADTAGIVVPHDQQQLAVALRSLLENSSLYAKLQEGCRTATLRLGWEQPIEQMEALYARLAGLPHS
jgi:glycosyltransferase involved in cell wall biosynthesis